MNIIILGTIGIDTLKTPFGLAKEVIGGSAVYSAYSASFFNECGIISVKGNDLPEKDISFLKKRGVSLEGVRTEGKNFRWSGEYEFDMNEAKTLKTELNSLASFEPYIPESYKDAGFAFLANIDPEIQLKVINSLKKPEIVVIDTMNFWIESKKDKVIEAIAKSDVLILNEGEARELFKTPSLVKAAKNSLKLGIKAVIIKKGEHGSLLFTKDDHFNCPGYPLEDVIDPTGCGDSFGGAFISHYSKSKDMKKAMVYASVIASFNAEGFGLSSLQKVSMDDIEKRYREMVSLRSF
ncbi:sugar kinase [Candidatus Woesearchaeota archaeon]|nr:sugar kinase [Candidatus Woesearchaeota archaeon]